MAGYGNSYCLPYLLMHSTFFHFTKDTGIWMHALPISVNYKSSCLDVYKTIHRDENVYQVFLYQQIIQKRIEKFVTNHFYILPLPQ